MASWLGDMVTGLGYAASSVAGRNVGVGLGGWLSGANNPQYKQTTFAAPQPTPGYIYSRPQTVNITAKRDTGVLGLEKTGMPSNPTQQQNNPVQSFYDQGLKNIQSQGDDAMSLIDQDYQNAMGYLSSQEGSIRGDASTAQQAADLSGSRLSTSLGEETATREQAAQDYLSTGEKEYGSAIQQARDLFRQTQQNNIAQLSALGISSSSVSEALAEKLGVETARRLSSYTGSIADLRLGVQKEIGNIKSYAARKSTENEEDLKIQKQQITSQMMGAINSLNYQRNLAATERARGRAGILAQAQNAMLSITQDAAKWQQQIQQWEKTQTQKVYGAVVDIPSKLAGTVNTLREKPEFTGLDWTPSVSWNKAGDMTGQLTGRVSSTKSTGKPDKNKNWWEQ